MFNKKIELNGTTLILIALVLGALFGLSFPQAGQSLSFIGEIFLRLVQMGLGLLILGQVSVAIARLNLRKLGKLGSWTVGLFLVSVLFSTIWGVLWAAIFKPGESLATTSQAANGVMNVESQSLTDVIVGFFPSNIFESLTEGSMMQITVFAIVFGAALSVLKSQKDFKFMSFLEEFNQIILEMMRLVMKVAPIGIFSLVANAMGSYGVEVILPLAYYVVVYLGAVVSYMIIWIFITAIAIKESPWQIGKQLLNMTLFAFASNSSAVALPVQMEDSRKKLGISENATSFVMPLGMTLNSPGSALHNSMILVIAGQMHGLTFTMGDYMTAILIGTFASYATAVIPGGGLVSLNMVLPQMGFGPETIALFATVDYPTGMMRTMTNVHNDATIGLIAADQVGELDHDVLNENNHIKQGVYSSETT